MISARILLISIGLACLFIWPASLAAQAPTSDDAYWQLVQDTQALLETLQSEPRDVQRQRLSAIAERWDAVSAVTINDEPVPANHDHLINQLRSQTPNLSQLTAQLDTLAEQRDLVVSPRHTAADLESLPSIFERREFQWQTDQQPSPLDELWQWLLGRFWEFITQFIPEEALIDANGSWLQWLINAVGVALMAIVLALIFRELLRNLASESQLLADSEADNEPLTSDSARQRAQSIAETGDYRTAVRYLYLSSLLLLDERGLLRYERSQTNREYLRSVAHSPQLAAILRDVIDVFDQVWYGYRSLDAAAYANYAARVAELREQQ